MRGAPWGRLRLPAVLVGATLGSAGRGVPSAIAARAVGTPRLPPCGMEEVLECVVRDSPTLAGGLARFALATLATTSLLAVVGVVAVVVGIVSHRRVRSFVLVGIGVMLVTPAAWLAGSVLVFVAT